MAAHGGDWDYCDIRVQLRYKGEDPTRGGFKTMWFVFQASASGVNQNYVAGESIEVPVPANVVGGSLSPQKSNALHVNVHQELLKKLQQEGWEQLPGKGSTWWEKRLRRPALPKKGGKTFLSTVFTKRHKGKGNR